MAMHTSRPTIFIGSSTKALPVAEEIGRRLSDIAMTQVWPTAFNPGDWTLQAILDKAQEADFGAFVFAADDDSRIKGKRVSTVRDNVLFEAGVFMGSLGPERTFLLWPEHQEAKLRVPSDLVGLTSVPYRLASSAIPSRRALPPKGLRLRADLGKIRSVIGAKGPALRSGYNELLSLVQSLNEQEQIFEDDSTESYLSIVTKAAVMRRRPWFRSTDVEILLNSVHRNYKSDVVDNVFWWLIVYGVITFRGIDVWSNGRWHWRDSVEHSQFTQRGAVLLNELKAKRWRVIKELASRRS